MSAFEHFNSHAHVERDKKAYNEMTDDENFNSHAHVERDLFVKAIADIILIDFNSHAHVERDTP